MKRDAIEGCLEKNYEPLRASWDNLPPQAQALASLDRWKTLMTQLCADAARTGTLSADGDVSREESLDLLVANTDLVLPFCVSASLSDQAFVELLGPREGSELAEKTCRTLFSAEYLPALGDAARAEFEKTGDLGSTFTAIYSGELFDYGAFYRDHPELIVPAFVAGELKTYDSEFSAGEKLAFPRRVYKKYVERLYTEAIRQGIVDLRGIEPKIDQGALERVAEEIVAEMHASGELP